MKSAFLLCTSITLTAGISLQARELKQPLEPKDIREILNLKTSATIAPFSLNTNYLIDNSWPNGYQVTVTLMNQALNPTTSWTASFQLPQGQSISSLWNGVYSDSGQSVTVKNPSRIDGDFIPGEATITFGMIISNPDGNPTMGLMNFQAYAE